MWPEYIYSYYVYEGVYQGEGLALEGVGVGGETEDTGDIHHS